MSTPYEVLAQLLSQSQADTLKVTGESTWEAAANALATISGAMPALQEISGRLVMPDEIAHEFGDPHLGAPLEVSTNQDQSATAYLVVPTAIAAMFLDSEADDPGDQEQQTMVIASTVLGQLLQALNQLVFGTSPSGLVLSLDDFVANGMPTLLATMDEPMLALSAMLRAESRILPLTLLLPGTFLDIVAGAMPVVAAPAPAVVPASPAAPAQPGAAASTGGFELPFSLTDDELEAAELFEVPPARAAASLRQAASTPAPADAPLASPFPPPSQREPTPIATQRARFAPLPDAEPVATRSTIDLLAGLQMNVTVELGRTHLTVADVLGLGAGSVVELDRLAGEPVDILVNDRLIARGEVVVVDENFGVRVVEVIRRTADQEERAG